MSCTIKEGQTMNTLVVVQELRPPELAIILAVEQSSDLAFDENTNIM
jgi:hypothetical protein